MGRRLRPGNPLGNCSRPGSVGIPKLGVSSSTHIPNSVGVINEQTVQSTIPHLQAAQVGMLAPIIPVDNNLVMATARQIHGVTNAAFAPARALFGTFGLAF
jgi:hypothetical protein